jgi:adenosylcobinamide-phosphate synthase
MDSMHCFILPAAFALDAVAGDPRWLPHPIRWMGRAIEICEPLFRRQFNNEVWAGGLFALFLISGCYAVSALLTGFAYAVRPFLGMALEVIMIFYCLSARSLYQAAMQIYYLLQKGHIDEARSKLAMIVGRDVAAYGRDDIARAAVETVAENFVDGVLSPLFFAAIGGAPLSMAYKMVNTLDSMVGYKNDRYLRFGRIAARIDDLANYIPARLCVPIIALATQIIAGRNGLRAMNTGFREGAHHSSPNAGYPEAAFAGALGVKLNGPNTYGGRLVDKPFIGVAFGSAGVQHVQRACQLMMVSAFLGCVAAWCLSSVWR